MTELLERARRLLQVKADIGYLCEREALRMALDAVDELQETVTAAEERANDRGVEIHGLREALRQALDEIERMSKVLADVTVRDRRGPDFPHCNAAYINALAEEGTKAEAIGYLQKEWNTACALRAAIRAALPPPPESEEPGQ